MNQEEKQLLKNIALSQTPTCELCAELARREAVQEFAVDPYEPFELTIDGKEVPAEKRAHGNVRGRPEGNPCERPGHRL